jgi:hypothetical protein
LCQGSGGLADHDLLGLEGFPLPVEPILKGEELLLLAAQLLLMVAGLFLPGGEPCLEQAQAGRSGVGTFLAGVHLGLPHLGLLQTLPGVCEETISAGPSLVQEELRRLPRLLPSQGWVGRSNGEGVLCYAAAVISVASARALARISPAVVLASARISSASSAVLERIRFLHRRLTMRSRALVKVTAPLHGFAEEAPAFVKLGMLSGSGPGDPVAIRGE